MKLVFLPLDLLCWEISDSEFRKYVAELSVAMQNCNPITCDWDICPPCQSPFLSVWHAIPALRSIYAQLGYYTSALSSFYRSPLEIHPIRLDFHPALLILCFHWGTRQLFLLRDSEHSGRPLDATTYIIWERTWMVAGGSEWNRAEGQAVMRYERLGMHIKLFCEILF